MKTLDNNQTDQSQEPQINNFIINYEDGTQEIVEKGFFCKISENAKNEEKVVNFFIANCNVSDLEIIVQSCIQLGTELDLI